MVSAKDDPVGYGDYYKEIFDNNEAQLRCVLQSYYTNGLKINKILKCSDVLSICNSFHFIPNY